MHRLIVAGSLMLGILGVLALGSYEAKAQDVRVRCSDGSSIYVPKRDADRCYWSLNQCFCILGRYGREQHERYYPKKKRQ